MSGNVSLTVTRAWQEYEHQYQPVRNASLTFVATAGLVGAQMIQDVPTRLEYMRMIRAEADDILAQARRNPARARELFDKINARRDQLRLIAQDRAKAATAVLSKLLTKDRTKYQILVSAANALAREDKIPSVMQNGQKVAKRLEDLTPEQLEDVFLKAIEKAGGSRKTIGQEFKNLLYTILDDGWTSGSEYKQMEWLSKIAPAA